MFPSVLREWLIMRRSLRYGTLIFREFRRTNEGMFLGDISFTGALTCRQMINKNIRKKKKSISTITHTTIYHSSPAQHLAIIITSTICYQSFRPTHDKFPLPVLLSIVLVIPSTKSFRSTLCTFEKGFVLPGQEWREEESYESMFPFQQLWKNAI